MPYGTVKTTPSHLRLRPNLPLDLEHKLCTKYGFVVIHRGVPNGYISLRKDRGAPVAKPATLVYGPSLTATQRNMLTKRLDGIVDFFPDPYKAEEAVRRRIHNLTQGLSNAEREFVELYLKSNFPIHAKA